MKMNEAIDLINFLQNKGYKTEVYEDYSGREMYGSTTVGVVTDANFNSMIDMIEDMENAEIDPAFERDNMALEYIYY